MTEEQKVQELLKPKKERHKWKKKIDHPCCHKYVCEKCGATKDSSALNIAIYWIGDEKYYKAPPCTTLPNTTPTLAL